MSGLSPRVDSQGDENPAMRCDRPSWRHPNVVYKRIFRVPCLTKMQRPVRVIETGSVVFCDQVGFFLSDGFLRRLVITSPALCHAFSAA
jgi:hypothetical protein